MFLLHVCVTQSFELFQRKAVFKYVFILLLLWRVTAVEIIMNESK